MSNPYKHKHMAIVIDVKDYSQIDTTKLDGVNLIVTLDLPSCEFDSNKNFSVMSSPATRM